MERLRERLERVQDQLLTLYEKNSDDLNDQIEHWKLVRQENVLLNAARRHGLTRVGLIPVPSRVVTETRGKAAIEMQLTLESLAKSPYAKEPWTLSQTSREAWTQPPELCLQKGPQTVTVTYDNDSSNQNEYTAWNYIYYQDEDDKWNKVTGHVDYYGMYYFQGPLKRYYLTFEEDAARYGTSGQWEVSYKNQVFFPVSSTTPDSPGLLDPGSGGQKKRRAQDPLSSPSTPSPSSSQRVQASPGRRRRSARGRQPRGRQRSGRRKQAVPGGSEKEGPVLPEEVGRRSQTLGRRPGSRLSRLIQEARDPPVVLIGGGANNLKCLRYRLTKKYSKLFAFVTSTFKWVGFEGGSSSGEGHRIMISFLDSKQQQTFLREVPIPKGFFVAKGSLDSL